MKRYWIVSAIAVLALLTMAPVASARGRFFIGGGYGYYPGYGAGWYGPYWGPRYYGPYPYGAYQNTGNVKIVTETKGDQIFVDGGFAGLTGKLKKFPLRPGVHTVGLRDPSGRSFYQERIEVIRGKTLEIHPDFKG